MTWQLICMFVSAFVCLIAPAAIAIVMILKRRGSLKAFALGVAAFTVSQLLIRIPLLGALQNTVWYNLFSVTHTMLIAFIAALSAGVFEEGARFLGIRFLMKKHELDWGNAFVFGLGHGGVEAFALVGIPYFKLIVNTLSGKDIAAVWNTPAAAYLLGGAERVLAMAIHIGLTMLVFYAVRRRNLWFFVLAIAGHTLVDFIIPLLKSFGVSLGLWESEGVLAVLAVLAVVLTVVMRRPLKPVPDAAERAEQT